MVIALYNLGVEHEHLHQYNQALDYFKRAMTHNKDFLNQDPHMQKVIIEGLQSVQQKNQKK